LALLAVSSTARASPTFPTDIQCALELAAAPRCNLCHGSVAGGGPVATPFGKAMVERGLTLGDDESVAPALTQMAADKVKSDGASTDDIQQLRDGRDPNTGGELDVAPAASCSGASIHPDFGCVARMAPSPAGASSAVVLCALWVVSALRARRRGSAAALAGLDARRKP
jgi:hypothetical protein